MPDGSKKWHKNSMRPPDPAQLGRWRAELSAAEISFFEEFGGTALKRFGFPLVNAPSTLRLKLEKAIYYAKVRLMPKPRPARAG